MTLLYWFESIRLPALDAFMSLVTRLGEETFFMAAALFVFWCRDKRRGYYLLSVGFVGTLVNQWLKIVCRVPRPRKRRAATAFPAATPRARRAGWAVWREAPGRGAGGFSGLCSCCWSEYPVCT